MTEGRCSIECPVCGEGRMEEVYHPYDIAYGRPPSFMRCISCKFLMRILWRWFE